MSITETSCLILDETSLQEVDITPQEYNDILDMQQNILAKIAAHENSDKILSHLCLLAEKLLPNSVASIMLKDPTTNLINVLSAPSVPQAAHTALANLQPGVHSGSCGNAVFRNEPQYVSNTFEDSRWLDLKQVAIDYNICSCWSMPVRNEKTKEAIGTFALSSFEHRSPAPFHKKLLQTAALIVYIVLNNKENELKIKLFSSATQHAAEGVIVTDKNENIIEVNQAFSNLYGYEAKDILGKNPRILSSGKQTTQFYLEMWNQINKKGNWAGEIINKDSNDNEITQWISISAHKNDQGQVENYFAIFSDLSELKKMQKEMQKMAFTDELTQLHNKAYLEEHLSGNDLKTLILLNVNNFSYINTAYGFEVGDKILKEIATILKYNFKTQATCRINADEFAMLFDNKIDIKEMVEQIKDCFYSQEVNVDNIAFNISFSYGGSYGSIHNLRNSALALKQAKENGKNTYYIYRQDKFNIDQEQRQSFIEANNTLHSALSEDKLIPFFQGIRDNKTGEITKFEALARLRMGTEIITPFKFLEPARLAGLLPEITKIMIDKSFKVMQKYDYSFSINITEDDLNHNYLLSYITQKSSEYSIEPSRVGLEILEGISSNAKHSNLEQLKQLKKMGYRIAIDDFGTEYSNFERVLDLEIDYLKIDAKYIKDIDTNKKSYEIVKAITYFAKNTNIPCIAEFVHNKNVQDVIENLGIEYSQGYYFSEPKLNPISEDSSPLIP